MARAAEEVEQSFSSPDMLAQAGPHRAAASEGNATPDEAWTDYQ
jgi:hypothetical protein